MEFAGDTVVTVLLRDKAAFVVGPDGRGEDGLESFGLDGGLGVGRPGEENITEVEDESRRFRKGHDSMYGNELETEGGAPTGKTKGNIAKYL